jgi:hypothetical protein
MKCRFKSIAFILLCALAASLCPVTPACAQPIPFAFWKTAEGGAPGVSSCEELQMISYHPAYLNGDTYVLATDIDCSATDPSDPDHAASLWGLGYAARYPNGFDGVAGNNPATGFNDDNIALLSLANLGAKGFRPLGYPARHGPFGLMHSFDGIFDGQGHVIAGLMINRPSERKVGLFSESESGAILKNIRLSNVNISGLKEVGALVGRSWSNISRTSSSGSVMCGFAGPFTSAGGLVGYQEGGYIKESYSSAVVVTGDGDTCAGGLVGYQASSGKIENCYATGGVRGGTWTDEPPGGSAAGGLVGSTSGLIVNSYATGEVTRGYFAGGFVGAVNVGCGDVENSFSTGVQTTSGGRGFIESYSCGTPENNWWYNNVNSQPNRPGEIQKAVSTEAFYDPAHAVYTANPTKHFLSGYGGLWDFSGVWNGSDPNALPHLRWQDD